jgi:signal transduction histidine kinase/ActR/RegA family two-component response regulator
MDSLLDTAPCGFLAFTDDGRVVMVNTTLLKLLGRELGEVQGKHVESILSVAGRIFYQTHLFPMLKMHGKVDEMYLLLRSKSGENVPMLANAVRRERDGMMVNDCVFVPMRQRSRYEEEILQAKKEAEEANRLKDDFLATVSHELRTPLTAMLGWVHILRNRALDPQRVAHAVEVIERNARAQAQLIEDLLDVSRIVSGKMRLDVQPVDPAELIETAIESVRPAADAKSVQVQKVLDSGAGPISGDAARLQQVIWNLLSNAIKFTPQGGQVQVRLERINSHVEITVNDTGAGISPEFLPYVFERFRQADQKLNRHHGGLGLGLAIVRHLVELHGGEVRVYSQGEGQGATFTVVLPLIVHHQLAEDNSRVHPRASIVSRSIEVTQRLDSVRVLIVDDEADTRDLLTMILRQYGAEASSAGSAREAIARLNQQLSDVMVSDIGMPDEDGYELIRQVRALPAERGGNTPAIALTAYARVEDRLKAFQAGYQMYIAKPVEPAELVAVIASLLERNP